MSPCSSNPCLNGGACSIFNITNFKCSCPSNFTGNVCQNCKKKDFFLPLSKVFFKYKLSY